MLRKVIRGKVLVYAHFYNLCFTADIRLRPEVLPRLNRPRVLNFVVKVDRCVAIGRLTVRGRKQEIGRISLSFYTYLHENFLLSYTMK